MDGNVLKNRLDFNTQVSDLRKAQQTVPVTTWLKADL